VDKDKLFKYKSKLLKKERKKSYIYKVEWLDKKIENVALLFLVAEYISGCLLFLAFISLVSKRQIY